MYSTRTRTAFRVAVSSLTGLAIAGSGTAAGYLTGVAARDSERTHEAAVAHQAGLTRAATRRAYAAWLERQPRSVDQWRQRPRRTEVHTRVVHQGGSVALGGGSVSAYSGSSGSSSSGGSSGGSGGGAAAPPPPPPPPPASTSGS